MRAAEDDTCVLFSNRRVFLLPFPSLVLQVIENGEVYQKLKGFPALSILRWNQDGIRGAHQALRPGLHDLRGYRVLHKGTIRWKMGLALISSSGQRGKLSTSHYKVN